MARHEFSDDPSNPLNQRINDIWSWGQQSVRSFEQIRDICREIYSMGFEDGQSYVWKMRSMTFIDDPENPGKQKAVFPGDPDYPKMDGFIKCLHRTITCSPYGLGCPCCTSLTGTVWEITPVELSEVRVFTYKGHIVQDGQLKKYLDDYVLNPPEHLNIV